MQKPIKEIKTTGLMVQVWGLIHDLTVFGKKALLVLVLLALLGYAVKSVYDRREVLAYAYQNPEKVAWLVVADRKVKTDADLKLKESVSRVFMEAKDVTETQ